MFSTDIKMVRINRKSKDVVLQIIEADAECEALHWTISEPYVMAVDCESEDPVVVVIATRTKVWVAECLASSLGLL